MTTTLAAPAATVAGAAPIVAGRPALPYPRVAAGDGDEVRLVAPARLVATTAQAYRLLLLDVTGRAPARLTVDMSAVEALDVAGAAVLVGAARRLRRAGGRLVLVGCSEAVRACLRRSGLAAVLTSPPGDEPASR